MRRISIVRRSIHEDTVVNDGICTIFSGDPQCAVTFSRSTWADKGNYVHCVPPLFRKR